MKIYYSNVLKPTVHSSRARTRYVHDALARVRNAHGLHVHANCKPRTAE